MANYQLLQRIWQLAKTYHETLQAVHEEEISVEIGDKSSVAMAHQDAAITWDSLLQEVSQWCIAQEVSMYTMRPTPLHRTLALNTLRDQPTDFERWERAFLLHIKDACEVKDFKPPERPLNIGVVSVPCWDTKSFSDNFYQLAQAHSGLVSLAARGMYDEQARQKAENDLRSYDFYHALCVRQLVSAFLERHKAVPYGNAARWIAGEFDKILPPNGLSIYNGISEAELSHIEACMALRTLGDSLFPTQHQRDFTAPPEEVMDENPKYRWWLELLSSRELRLFSFVATLLGVGLLGAGLVTLVSSAGIGIGAACTLLGGGSLLALSGGGSYAAGFFARRNNDGYQSERPSLFQPAKEAAEEQKKPRRNWADDMFDTGLSWLTGMG